MDTHSIPFRSLFNTRWRNVYVDIILTCFITLQSTMGLGNLYDSYIFLMFNEKNSWVGYFSGARGMIALITVFPIGLLVDRWNRYLLCKAASLIMIICTSAGLYAIWFNSMIMFIIYNVLIRFSIELTNSIAGAIFADSLLKYERTKYFTLRGTFNSLSLTVGPTISLLFFTFYQNSWDTGVLKILLASCLAVCGPMIALLLLLLKPQYLSSELEMTLMETRNRYPSSNNLKFNEQYSPDKTHGKIFQKIPQGDDFTTQKEFKTEKFNSIPYIVLASGIIRGFGAGMMVTFLPLFFKAEYNLKPNQLSLIYLLQAFTISIFTQFSRFFVHSFGLYGALITYGFAAICLLVGLTLARDLKYVIFFFLLRGGIQNSVKPLEQSLIMDQTSSKDRGKWNAATSFSQIIFSGSALIGGFIADANDYRFIFFLASIFSSVALVTQLIIFFQDNQDNYTEKVK